MTMRHECALVEDRLPALLENDLPPGETLLIRAHLFDCRECAAAVAEYESITASIVAERVDDDLLERALAKTRASIESPHLPPLARQRFVVGAALALGLVGYVFGPPSGASLARMAELPHILVRSAEPITNSLHLPAFFAHDESPNGGSRR